MKYTRKRLFERLGEELSGERLVPISGGTESNPSLLVRFEGDLV